jgi:hypothetical protein
MCVLVIRAAVHDLRQSRMLAQSIPSCVARSTVRTQAPNNTEPGREVGEVAAVPQQIDPQGALSDGQVRSSHSARRITK